MNELEQAALIRRCQAGDKEAFRILVDQNRGALFGTAYLMTHDRNLAQDAVQGALVKIWRHLPSLRIHSSFKAWILRIVVNEVKQQGRKKRVPTVSLEQAPDVVDDPVEEDSKMVSKEERQSLRQALGLLPPDQRQVVVLRYFSELTVAEVAAATGQREGTVKSRLSRALERLRAMLKDDEADEGERK